MVIPPTSCIHHGTATEVGGAWGAAYAVGTPISALVTGICCALATEYFQQFPQDATRIRCSVIVVVATTIFGLFLAMDLTYVRLVKNSTPPGGFGDIPWQDDAVALICGICQLICSAYFAYSAYSVATRKKLLLVWYGLLMVVIFLSAFFRAILGLIPTDWFDGAALCPKMTFMWLIGSLLLDFSIAVTLLAYLRRAAPTPVAHINSLPPPSTLPNPPSIPSVVQQSRAPLLSRLLTTILTSFSLTAILMFSLLILVLAMHGTEFDARLPKATGIFTALRLLATPTYAVTFLYTLNRRNCRASPHNFTPHEQILPSAPRGIGPTNFLFRPWVNRPQTPSTCFTTLGTASTRRASRRDAKKSQDELRNFDLEAFSKAFPFASSQKNPQNDPPVLKPPPPIHSNENKSELMSQACIATENCSSLNPRYFPEPERPTSSHSNVVVQIYQENSHSS